MTTQARELAGIITNAGDLLFDDDVTLQSDGAILNFGADSDVTLTHIADTALLLNSTRRLQFGDSGTYINQSSNGVLNITSDTEVEINATTVDINANVDVSGNITLAGTITVGDADDDNMIINANVNSHIIPNTDDTFDLGSSGQQWRNLYINGTAEIDAITIGGVTLSETIADTVGGMVASNTESGIAVTYEDGDNTLDFVIGTLNQDTTGTADNFTASANNSTDETVYPVFIDGATGSQGAETDTGLTYNPSSGIITATQFTGAVVGNVTGNVTGDTSGSAATVTTAAQPAITSLGTLSTLAVDNITVNSNDISTTNSNGNLTLTPNGTGIVSINKNDGFKLPAGTTAQRSGSPVAGQIRYNSTLSTFEGYGSSWGSLGGTIDVDQDTKITAESGAGQDEDILTFYVGVSNSAESQMILADGVLKPTADDNIDLGTSSLQFKNAYFDGTIEADAITVDGTTLLEYIADTVGSMVTGNTETRFTATYDDTNNKLDFVGQLEPIPVVRVYSRSSMIDCTLDSSRDLVITGRAGNISVVRAVVPVSVIPAVTIR
jgi:hypothetical protein